MKNLYRVLVSVLSLLMMMLAMLLLAGCNGAPGCPQAGFGNSPACQSGGGGNLGGGGGGGGGGGSNPTPAAFVYAVDQGTGSATTGTIDGYDLSTSAGKFVPLTSYTAPQVPLSDTGEGMVVVNKKFVYTIFELQQSEIAGWSIDSGSGVLTVLSGFPIPITLSLPINSPGQFQMTTDPGGNYLFISSTGANAIFVYAINSSTGALTAVPGSPFSTIPAGIEPGNITTDGLGRFLYVCLAGTHQGGEFVGYSIGAGTGVLTLIPGGPFGVSIWQLEGDASGHYLVGTSGSAAIQTGLDDLHLYVYSIDQTTGAAAQVATSPFSTTFSPYTIAMQPASSNGEFVYSFSINATGTGFNGIEGYQLNTTTGLLTKITGSPFGNASAFLGQWGQFDQSGSNLLVYSNVLTQSGFVTQLGPMSVASDGTLTDPIAPITLTTAGYWVVTDP